MVVINSTKPILVALSIPQRYLDEVRRARAGSQLKVDISANRGGQTIAQGEIVFIDNAVNVQTGTILLKARAKNEHEELWPGQFVAARIILKVEQDAIALPETSVQPGQDRQFVYLVKDGKAVMQPVQVSRQIGNLVVVSKGVSAGDQVVVDVPFSLTDGSAIQIRQPGDDAKRKSEGGKSEGGKSEGVKSEGEKPASKAETASQK